MLLEYLHKLYNIDCISLALCVSLPDSPWIQYNMYLFITHSCVLVVMWNMIHTLTRTHSLILNCLTWPYARVGHFRYVGDIGCINQHTSHINTWHLILWKCNIKTNHPHCCNIHDVRQTRVVYSHIHTDRQTNPPNSTITIKHIPFSQHTNNMNRIDHTFRGYWVKSCRNHNDLLLLLLFPSAHSLLICICIKIHLCIPPIVCVFMCTHSVHTMKTDKTSEYNFYLWTCMYEYEWRLGCDGWMGNKSAMRFNSFWKMYTSNKDRGGI